MHIEFLIEDQSGEKMLEHLLPKLIEEPHTYKIHSYKGVGRIPKNMRSTENAGNRILLENLPKLLKGYGKTFAGWGDHYPAAVVLICDLDDKCPVEFKQQLNTILAQCQPQPETRFCFAIEEGEAWFLGDLKALKAAYPKADDAVLQAYIQDSICGTWETLADAVYPGGSIALGAKGWIEVGRMKSEWAETITALMDLQANRSPSFAYFKTKTTELINHR